MKWAIRNVLPFGKSHNGLNYYKIWVLPGQLVRIDSYFWYGILLIWYNFWNSMLVVILFSINIELNIAEIYFDNYVSFKNIRNEPLWGKKSTTAKHFDYSREQFMFIKNWQLHIHKSRKRYKSQAFMYLYYFYGMIKKTHKFWMISWFGHLKIYKSHRFSHNHLHFFPDKFICKVHTYLK